MRLPYPGLDGRPHRITPIPISAIPNQPAIQKSPEEIQRETFELIQRLRKEDAEQEELAKKYKEMNVF